MGGLCACGGEGMVTIQKRVIEIGASLWDVSRSKLARDGDGDVGATR